MPEQEGYIGIMEDGKAKELVGQALKETVRQAKLGVTSFEMGIDLGRLFAKEDGGTSAGK